MLFSVSKKTVKFYEMNYFLGDFYSAMCGMMPKHQCSDSCTEEKNENIKKRFI